MSSSDKGRNDAAAARESAPGAAPAPGAGAADPYASWLDRMQRARTRHAAITKNLYTWSNYKSWADRVKNSWDQEESK
ncbi:MAG TPA: hypothetical protein VIL32_02270 [Steroidobacteraceae bacterium]